MGDVFFILFHFLSIYLCWHDFLKKSVPLVPYIFCIVFLFLYIFKNGIILNVYSGLLIFISIVILFYIFYKKMPVAFADILYAGMILWIVGADFYLYFIAVGIFSLLIAVFCLDKNRKIPFLPALYAAFLLIRWIRFI
ncbi:MAG: hypothetical protein HEEMFOPI_00010 [Holosporales bacterium]